MIKISTVDLARLARLMIAGTPVLMNLPEHFKLRRFVRCQPSLQRCECLQAVSTRLRLRRGWGRGRVGALYTPDMGKD